MNRHEPTRTVMDRHGTPWSAMDRHQLPSTVISCHQLSSSGMKRQYYMVWLGDMAVPLYSFAVQCVQ